MSSFNVNCLYICLSIFLSVDIYLIIISFNYLTTYKYLSIYLSISLTMYIYISLSIYPTMFISIRLKLAIFLSVCINLIIQLPIFLYQCIYPSIYLSIYLDLSDCQLMQMPDAVYHLMRNTPLVSCNLSSNVIAKIPPKFPLSFSLITGDFLLLLFLFCFSHPSLPFSFPSTSLPF